MKNIVIVCRVQNIGKKVYLVYIIIIIIYYNLVLCFEILLGNMENFIYIFMNLGQWNEEKVIQVFKGERIDYVLIL